MKKIFYLITSFFLFVGSSPTSTSQKKLTGNIATDLKILLPVGISRADIMDGNPPNSRRDELSAKFMLAIKNNYNWFLEYAKDIPEGKPMPYHPNFGLTKEEYTELLDYMNNTEVVSSGSENITISIQHDTIHFNAGGKLSDLNSLMIDLKANQVLFKKYQLPFYKTVNIAGEKNGFKSKWKGYDWAFYEPQKLDINDYKDLSNLNKKDYTVTIGKLEKTNQTFLHFEAREVVNGQKTVQIDLPVVF
ncbi:MAG: hypothetical protein ABJA78_18080 [Ferruginibacter sp.]